MSTELIIGNAKQSQVTKAAVALKGESERRLKSPSKALVPSRSHSTSNIQTARDCASSILPQKRKSLSKEEKKVHRLKVAQAKQAEWKRKHTNENRRFINAKKTNGPIVVNIKYDLLSYIMLGKKSILLRPRRGIYQTLRRGDTSKCMTLRNRYNLILVSIVPIGGADTTLLCGNISAI